MPKGIYPWITYARWGEQYGDVIYYNTPGTPVLLLNSRQAMSDLLDKRADIYSSRPYRTMVIDILGLDYLFTSMLYGERWKRHRNLFIKYFKRAKENRDVYNSVQIRYTHAFLRDLLGNPVDFRQCIRRSASAVVLGLVYGHGVAEEGDTYVDLASQTTRSLGKCGLYGTYYVDYFPWLRHVPAWFPLATFQRKGQEWRKPVREMLERPFAVTKAKMLEGKASSCLVSVELEDLWAGTSTFTEDIVKNTAATAFAAGSDTVVSGIHSFFLAAAVFPEVQQMAQAELDRVLCGRLPTIQDRPDLPLIESICYEVLRWNPVIPLSLSHYVSEDNEYRGYHIPKGTTVYPNVHGVLHSEKVYPDPFSFKADRFLDREANERLGINPLPDIVFGFGRRFCPGRDVALDFLFLVISSLNAVYQISKATDAEGKVIEPAVEYEGLWLVHPKPFRCDIRPRSDKAREVIEETINNEL
ncbi:cytochrome P450 [Coprinopsis sp. MPI-PUGE-AT-0042]|nr:cytochrome P450 [Coprinopsis sp. MPI-PUGE-AT-0042]